MYLLSYSNPVIIFGSVFLFLTFDKINIKNAYVNKIASSMFSVYLIQEGSEMIFHKDVYKFISICYLHYSFISFVLFILFYVLVLLVISIILDTILKMLIDYIVRFFTMELNSLLNKPK